MNNCQKQIFFNSPNCPAPKKEDFDFKQAFEKIKDNKAFSLFKIMMKQCHNESKNVYIIYQKNEQNLPVYFFRYFTCFYHFISKIRFELKTFLQNNQYIHKYYLLQQIQRNEDQINDFLKEEDL